ncbi:hypothetical protein VTK26DRAFT_8125 [Humicola hyalothermophila]
MQQQGMSNMLVHLSPDGQTVRALNLQSDVGSMNLHEFVESVTFIKGHRKLVRSEISGLSLLHYRELGTQDGPHVNPGLEYAELCIYYACEDMPELETTGKSIVHLHHATTLGIDESDESILTLKGVECFGFDKERQIGRLENTDVTFQMTSPEAAEQFYEQLEDMRMELFIASLQYPRPDETIALHLQMMEVHCEVAMISDAELLITRSKEDKYRLVVASRNRCTVLSQVLPETFFTSDSSQAPSYGAPTWLVQMEADGQRKVYHYPKGFKFLSFQSSNAAKIFGIGRTAVLQGASSHANHLQQNGTNGDGGDGTAE